MSRLVLTSATIPALAIAALTFATSAHAQFGGQPPAPGAGFAPQQAQQQPGAMEQFRQTLAQYGSFQNHPRYGEVWTPAPGVVQPGWRPYPVCHWSYDRQQQAWNFNDQTPWGQIVHHYGRWANDPSMGGWLWVPDGNYGPGWVQWQTNAGQVSWAALGPDQDGGQPSPDAWQSQDTQTFNAGCRQAAPPPVAQAPLAPRAAFGPAFVPVARPPIVVVGRGPGLCIRFPFHPACHRPHFPGGRFCSRFPLHPSCRFVNRPPRDRACFVNPNLPRCRGNLVGQLRGNQLRGNRPFGLTRPFANRPNFARPFPNRPAFARSFGGRPQMMMRGGGGMGRGALFARGFGRR